MKKIEKYIKEASIQKEDDLVFPQQDYQTLVMNLTALLKNDDE